MKFKKLVKAKEITIQQAIKNLYKAVDILQDTYQRVSSEPSKDYEIDIFNIEQKILKIADDFFALNKTNKR